MRYQQLKKDLFLVTLKIMNPSLPFYGGLVPECQWIQKKKKKLEDAQVSYIKW